MFVSITRSAGAALLVGSALLLGTPDARAQMMSSEEAFQQASDKCASASKGQRSFCMINAFNQFKVTSAAEMKQDETLHFDNNPSNDTPLEINAKETYNAEAARCASLGKGQRSYCMINAYNDYKKSMGWKN